MRTIYQKLATTLVLASTLLLCLNRADAQRLIYHVDLSHVAQHYVDISVQPTAMRPDTMILQMPIWAPGIYTNVHYGRFIRDLQAVDSNGNTLSVKQVKDDAWKIPSSNVAIVKYRIYDSYQDHTTPSLGLARIDANGLFANTEALFGYFDNDKGIPGTIIFTMPKEWMVATTLEPATDGDLSGDARYHQNVFNFSDYEALADAPLLIAPKFQTTDFTQNGVDYGIVVDGPNQFPIDSFARDAAQVLRVEASFFRMIPYRNYLFIISTSGQSPFAIAHTASSVYSLPGAAWEDQEPTTEQLLASTLFQTWNGKRFHISELGPVDFTLPIHAQSLWFSEGVSEYYAELLRVRHGLITTPEFFNVVEKWEEGADASTAESLEQLSEHLCKGNDPACLDLLRARGALVALMMDIEIRDKSNDRRSLDNVLFRMDRDAPHGKTYDDSLLYRTIDNYSETDLTAFYKDYIAGNEPLPVEAYLERMGAGSEVPISMKSNNAFGLNLALNTAGTGVISEVAEDSVVASAPLECGDTVCALNGEDVSERSIAETRSSMKNGKMVTLVLLHNKKKVPVVMRAKMPSRHPVAMQYRILPHSTRNEIAIRKALLGHRRMPRYRMAQASKAR